MENKNYLIEILMVAYNAENTIRSSLLSIFNQTFTEWRLVIINDGSTDNTQKIILENCKLIKTNKIQYIKLDKNLGLSKRLSDYKPNTKSLYLARIDADDLWMPQKLSYQLSFMLNDPDLSVLGSSALTKNDNQSLNIGKIKCHSLFLINKFILPFKNTFVHSSLLIRVSIFNQVGGYSKEYKYSQDYFLLMKILQIGKLRSLKKTLVLLKKSRNQISSKYKKEQIYYLLKAQVELNYSRRHIKVSEILNNFEISKFKKVIKLLPLTQYIFIYFLKFIKKEIILILKNSYNEFV